MDCLCVDESPNMSILVVLEKCFAKCECMLSVGIFKTALNFPFTLWIPPWYTNSYYVVKPCLIIRHHVPWTTNHMPTIVRYFGSRNLCLVNFASWNIQAGRWMHPSVLPFAVRTVIRVEDWDYWRVLEKDGKGFYAGFFTTSAGPRWCPRRLVPPPLALVWEGPSLSWDELGPENCVVFFQPSTDARLAFVATPGERDVFLCLWNRLAATQSSFIGKLRNPMVVSRPSPSIIPTVTRLVYNIGQWGLATHETKKHQKGKKNTGKQNRKKTPNN